MTTQPGYQEGNERAWWWRVAQHIDEAQLALVNAAAHNASDPAPVIALQERIREAQAILFYIFRVKGLMPAFGNGVAEAPKARSAAAPPAVQMPPMPASPPPGVPMPPMPAAAPPGMPMPPPIDVPPPPANWMPTDGVLGSWVSAAPSFQEIAPPSAEEPLVAPAENTEVVEATNGAVQPEILAPVAAPAVADPNPEA